MDDSTEHIKEPAMSWWAGLKFKIKRRIGVKSLRMAIKQENLEELIEKLRTIVPDITQQYSKIALKFEEYDELNLRGMHAFQCRLMLRALEDLGNKELSVVDIGDSAGTHMLYLKSLVDDGVSVNTISLNLDPRAVDKIRKKGLNALLKRAEDVTEEDTNGKVDLFVTFEMLEHLHNPALFLRRLAKRNSCDRLLVTVPYLKRSRVGLHNTKIQNRQDIFAEEEHIFELSPEDWQWLMLHSGWRAKYSHIYYQYPAKIPVISSILRAFWKRTDFEGFWGVILEKDLSISDHYQDWEE